MKNSDPYREEPPANYMQNLFGLPTDLTRKEMYSRDIEKSKQKLKKARKE